MAASAQGIKLVDESEDSSSRARFGVWSVVFGAVFDAMVSKENARIMLFSNANPGIRFVVLEEHIIARFVFLNHGVFEVESILFGGYDDIRHIGDSSNEEVSA